MIRDYETEPLPEDIINFEIPTPTFSNSFEEKEDLQLEEPEAVYFPSLSSMCTDVVSRNLNVENVIDTYE